VNLLDLLLKIVEESLVLDGSLIKLLVKTSLTDGSVGKIIELSDLNVVEFLCTILSHDVVDACNLLLESDDLVHERRSQGLVSDFEDPLLILIDGLIKSLDILIDSLSILLAKVSVLKALDILEKL